MTELAGMARYKKIDANAANVNARANVNTNAKANAHENANAIVNVRLM